MTVRELIVAADQNAPAVLGFLAAVPAAAAAAGAIHGPGRGAESPWKYVYSALVYAACVPGTFAATLTAYAFFFTNENLLDASLTVYLAPIVSTAVTLALIRRSVDFEYVPGFDKIGGLLGLLAATFLTALVLHRMRLFVVFGGGIGALALLAAGLFLLFRWSARTLIGPGSSARP